MDLFRKEDRHPVDPRVLIVRDIRDFRLWQNRHDLRIDGIIWDMVLDKAYIDRLAAQIKAAYCDNDYFREHNRLERDRRSFMTYANGVYLREHVGSKLVDDVGSEVEEIASQLRSAFALATQPEETHDTCELETEIRINVSSPYHFHAHKPALTFAFAQAGTTCCTGNRENPGQTYSIPLGQAGLLGPQIWHKVAEWPIKEDTRVNFVVGEPIDRRVISF
ncbi:MAG: hypothetical protein GC137_09385 [Alphaproteobacteria bacterium]|nr:hypothetical protein [Alphaproteobacteria bacterium]